MTPQEKKTGVDALVALEKKFADSAARKKTSGAPKDAAQVLAVMEYARKLEKEIEQLRNPGSIH